MKLFGLVTVLSVAVLLARPIDRVEAISPLYSPLTEVPVGPKELCDAKKCGGAKCTRVSRQGKDFCANSCIADYVHLEPHGTCYQCPAPTKLTPVKKRDNSEVLDCR